MENGIFFDSRPYLKWGDNPRHTWKQQVAMPILRRLNEKHKLGSVIADIGSGAHSLLDQIDVKKSKIIKVDTLAPERQTEHELLLNYDIQNLDRKVFSTGRVISKVAKFLNINAHNAPPQQLDSILLSDILNYVDYQRVIRALDPFLKSHGRIIIFNSTNIGITEQFSEKRPKSGCDISHFLDSIGYTLELEESSIPNPGFLSQAKMLFTGESVVQEPEIFVARKLPPGKTYTSRFT